MFDYRLKRIVLKTTDPFIKQTIRNQLFDDRVSVQIDGNSVFLFLSDMNFYETVDYLNSLPGVALTEWEVVEKEYQLSFMIKGNIALDINNCDLVETDLNGYITILKTQKNLIRKGLYEIIVPEVEDLRNLFLPVVSLNRNLKTQFLEFLEAEYVKQINVQEGKEINKYGL